MTEPPKPARRSPIFAALDEAIDDSTDDETENMLAEVVNAIWYGFDSVATIDAWIDQCAGEREPFDLHKVKATAAREFAKKGLAEAGWPQTTDCDRLDRAFARLHEQGICALHCAGDTQSEGIAAVAECLSDESLPDDLYHGYCFYYSQDIDSAFEGEGLLLAHGHVDRSEAPEEERLAVARMICETLQREGLAVEWEGSIRHRIGLPQLRWQRRAPA